MFYTFITYMGSSIHTPGQPAIQEEFGIGHVAATPTYSLFILGYAGSHDLFSNHRNVPSGKKPYLRGHIGFFLLVFQVGVATTHTFVGLLALRFITGFFSSPAISTGAATLGDVVSSVEIPYLSVCGDRWVGSWLLHGLQFLASDAHCQKLAYGFSGYSCGLMYWLAVYDFLFAGNSQRQYPVPKSQKNTKADW